MTDRRIFNIHTPLRVHHGIYFQGKTKKELIKLDYNAVKTLLEIAEEHLKQKVQSTIQIPSASPRVILMNDSSKPSCDEFVVDIPPPPPYTE